MFTDRRGVSETIGFVVIFALVVSTVGVVYTVGYAGLQDARDAERVNNAERAFDVLANNMADILLRGAPSRGTEIRLAEASIGAGPPTYINVSATNSSGSTISSGNYSIEPIVYEADDTQIRYAAGAVTRIQRDGSVMLNEPPFVLDAEKFVVPIVQVSTDDNTVAGSKTVLVRAERRIRQPIVTENQAFDTVTLTISTPAPEAWERYLTDAGMACGDPVASSNELTKLECTLNNVERVHVVWYEIKVVYE